MNEQINNCINNNKFVILFFYSDSCEHCIEMEKKITTNFGYIEMIRINIEKEKELAEKYSVLYIPTIIVLKDREIISIIVGSQDCIEYLNKIFML